MNEETERPFKDACSVKIEGFALRNLNPPAPTCSANLGLDHLKF